MRRLFFIIIMFAALINAQTYTSEPNVVYVGRQLGKYSPDSTGVTNAMLQAAILQNSSHQIITVDIAPGNYDLSLEQLTLKDSVYINWGLGTVMSSDNPAGTVIDDSIAVNSTWEGNPTLINTVDPALNINLKNAATVVDKSWIRPYKIYSAILNQSGTVAPVATVLENTIGAVIWSRSSAGTYLATLTGAFPNLKTQIFTQSVYNIDIDGTYAGILYRYTDNQLILNTRRDGLDDPSDIGFTNFSIEIRVYP